MTTWTRTKPTKPGWYWWRNAVGLERVYQVSTGGEGLFVHAFLEWVDNIEGEWSSEPIEEPSERL